jgi:hypothetical protein
MGMFIDGIGVGAGFSTLFIRQGAGTSESSNITLYTSGLANASGDQTMFIEGYNPASGSMDMFIGGLSAVASGSTLFTHGLGLYDNFIVDYGFDNETGWVEAGALIYEWEIYPQTSDGSGEYFFVLE